MYCGLTSFNARARAANFTPEELFDVVTYCHDRGVRVFVTLNVLIFEQELPAAEETIRAIATAGADAVIVQDVGVVELVRRVAPNLRIHGSTQMSITSGACLLLPTHSRRCSPAAALDVALAAPAPPFNPRFNPPSPMYNALLCWFLAL